MAFPRPKLDSEDEDIHPFQLAGEHLVQVWQMPGRVAHARALKWASRGPPVLKQIYNQLMMIEKFSHSFDHSWTSTQSVIWSLTSQWQLIPGFSFLEFEGILPMNSEYLSRSLLSCCFGNCWITTLHDIFQEVYCLVALGIVEFLRCMISFNKSTALLLWCWITTLHGIFQEVYCLVALGIVELLRCIIFGKVSIAICLCVWATCIYLCVWAHAFLSIWAHVSLCVWAHAFLV
jgi:hypothetical protein